MNAILTQSPLAMYQGSMTLLNEAVNAKTLDIRLIERNLSRNVITSRDYEQVLGALPDDAENAEWISIQSIMESSEEKHSHRS